MRNAEFDRKTVLCKAMAVFTAKGYGKTSMQDLTKATGLHPGSIYCAFESKKGLLLAAIEQYQQERNQQFARVFDNNNPSLENLSHYLDDIVSECQSGDLSQACLLTKTLNEIGGQDDDINTLITANILAWQQGLKGVFERAKATGELPSDCDALVLAQYLMMGIYGLRTFAHTHNNHQTLRQLADKLLAELRR
jgi:TetR/AcrR family transcriptional repressor of nem operon